MGPFRRKILIYFGIILCLKAAIPCLGSKIIRTSAKSLAERAGAAQYAVHIEEELTSEEIGKKHNLSKRRTSAFDDSDYEVYQGVVGRPGIDFPILSGIPQTTFNCRKFGNGYFADLETDCQVFHICEAGKKISFLCPNGTIFQQTDLICDWWFKVNCAASPGHYAESSEVLSRAQKRPQIAPENLSTEGLSESRESVEEKVRSGKEEIRRNQQKKLKTRNEETFDNINVSGENFDFEDISSESRKSNSRSRQSSRNVNRISHRNAKEISDDFLESQEVAESASFVVDRQKSNFNGYHYDPPKITIDSKTQSLPLNSTKNETSQNQSASINNTSDTFTGYIYNQPDRNSRRLETSTVRQESTNSAKTATKDTILPSTNPRRGSTNYQNQGTPSRQERKQNIHSSPTPNSLIPDDVKSTSAPLISRHPSTYTTARRLETSRTTPFYTPTVPSLIYRAPTVQNNVEPQTPISTTASTPSVSEHAMEMIRTIHELNLDNPRPTIESERPVQSSRPGLIIPPSSGPDTLHSLALYFATAVDNLMSNVTNAENQTTTSVPLRGDFPNLDVQIGNVTKITSSHVSNDTIEKYERLFGIENEEILSRSQLSSRMDSSDDTKFTSPDNDLETEFSNNPVLAAAGSPQIRELAKVFTHALSAYLHDPSTFRRVLSEIRPTEPPIAVQTSNDILSNRIGRTDDFNKGTGPTYLPTVATTSATATTTFAPTTEDFEVLDFSDVTLSTAKKELNYPSTTPSTTNPTTTDFPSTTTSTTNTESEESSTVLSNLIQESLNTADRVPASRFLTEQLRQSPEHREPKRLETTTDANNPFALEINGGLIMSTSFPYFQDDSRESSKQSLEDQSYFPAKETLESRSQLKPYGHDVNRSSSLINDTYPTALSDTQAVPLKWGEEITEDYSTQTTTEYPASLSFDLLPPSAVQKGFSLPIKDTAHQTIDDNDLQRAQSQSLVASGNELLNEQKGRSFSTTLSPRFGDRTRATTEYPTVTTTITGHFITHDYRTSTESPVQQSKTTIPDTGKFSPNPWSTLAYTVFLDPLTINDGLMDAKLKEETPSANTYLPRSTQTTPYSPSTTTSLPPVTSTDLPEAQALLNRNSDNDDARKGKFLSSSPFPTTIRDKQPAEYMEVMQKKANEMFGNLNDTSATHLLNVMKKANKNKTVRKLILLLIQTCDDDYNTTVEESRTALLNALIGMDGKIDDESDFQIINARTPNRRGKSIARFEGNSVTEPTSTETPITTFRRPLFTFSTTLAPQHLFESTTTNEPPRTTTVTTANPQYDDFSTTSTYRGNERYGIYFRTDGEYSTTTTSDDGYSHEPTDQTTFTAFEETTTLTPSTTTTTTTTTTTHRPTTTHKPTTNKPRSSQSRRIAKDLDDLLGQSSQSIDPSVSRTHKNSDTRALDLLRSLYSLAGRFGR